MRPGRRWLRRGGTIRLGRLRDGDLFGWGLPPFMGMVFVGAFDGLFFGLCWNALLSFRLVFGVFYCCLRFIIGFHFISLTMLRLFVLLTLIFFINLANNNNLELLRLS
jgi:hypothetical protein